LQWRRVCAHCRIRRASGTLRSLREPAAAVAVFFHFVTFVVSSTFLASLSVHAFRVCLVLALLLRHAVLIDTTAPLGDVLAHLVDLLRDQFRILSTKRRVLPAFGYEFSIRFIFVSS
jgi:hypothetical protein